MGRIDFISGKEMDAGALTEMFTSASNENTRKQYAPKPHSPKAVKRGVTEREDWRKAMICKVHIARQRMGMSDDVYRNMLEDKYGVNSSKKLPNGQLHELLLHFQEMGVQLKRGSVKRTKSVTERRKAKKMIPSTLTEDESGLNRTVLVKRIEALLAEKGRVEKTHVPWEYANGILKRQTGGLITHVDLANYAQLEKLMIALTMDARRKGRYAG